MNKFIKRIIITAAAGTLCAAICGCSAEKKKEKKKEETESSQVVVALDYMPEAVTAGLYAALEQGYFEKEGLELSILTIEEEGNQTPEELLASGVATFGIADQDVLGESLFEEGAISYRAFASLCPKNHMGILTAKDAGISDFSDLAGKRFSYNKWEVEDAMMTDVMAASGADYASVVCIPNAVTDIKKALEEGITDAIFCQEDQGLWALENGYAGSFLPINEKVEALDYCTNVIFSTEKWAKKNAKIIDAFLKALEKGNQYAMTYPKSAAKILKRFGAVESEEILEEEVALFSEDWKACKEQGQKTTYLSAERWTRFYAWMLEKGFIPEGSNVATGI